MTSYTGLDLNNLLQLSALQQPSPKSDQENQPLDENQIKMEFQHSSPIATPKGSLTPKLEVNAPSSSTPNPQNNKNAADDNNTNSNTNSLLNNPSLTHTLQALLKQSQANMVKTEAPAISLEQLFSNHSVGSGTAQEKSPKPQKGSNNSSQQNSHLKRTKQESIIRSGYGPVSIVGNANLINQPTTPSNININAQNGMIQDIPSIPLEYLKANFKTYDTRDIECNLCGHLFKAGKYKVNNTKLRQHVLAKHKDHLNVWLRSNGSSIFSEQHFELFERPWRCQICSKTYKLKHHLKQHMEASHNDFSMISKSYNTNASGHHQNSASHASATHFHKMNVPTLLNPQPNHSTHTTLIKQETNIEQSALASTLEALMAQIKNDKPSVTPTPDDKISSSKTSDEGHISPQSNCCSSNPASSSVPTSRNLSRSPPINGEIARDAGYVGQPEQNNQQPSFMSILQQHSNNLQINSNTNSNHKSNSETSETINLKLNNDNQTVQFADHQIKIENANSCVTNEGSGESSAKRPKLCADAQVAESPIPMNSSNTLNKLIAKMRQDQEKEEERGQISSQDEPANALAAMLQKSQPSNTALPPSFSFSKSLAEEKSEKSENPQINLNLPQTIQIPSSPKNIPATSTPQTTPTGLDLGSLASHLAAQTNTKTKTKAFICEHCQITFPDNIMYTLHMGQHCVNDPFKCNICNHKCSDRYDFMCHFAMGKHK